MRQPPTQGEVEATQDGHKKGGLPFPLLVAAGAIGAVAYFLLRRTDEDDYDEYGEDAFRYETDEEAQSDQVTG